MSSTIDTIFRQVANVGQKILLQKKAHLFMPRAVENDTFASQNVTRRVSEGLGFAALADATLKLRISSGLEARHILCRWREPPEYEKSSVSRPEGPTQWRLCRPFRPGMIYAAIPVAHATGRGYVGPPGLNRATSKLTLRVTIRRAKVSFSTAWNMVTDSFFPFEVMMRILSWQRM